MSGTVWQQPAFDLVLSAQYTVESSVSKHSRPWGLRVCARVCAVSACWTKAYCKKEIVSRKKVSACTQTCLPLRLLNIFIFSNYLSMHPTVRGRRFDGALRRLDQIERRLLPDTPRYM
ncbi:unnamed protein product [Pylaiella littoralis]